MILVRVYYTKFTRKLPEDVWNKYLDLLPDFYKKKNQRFFRWQDQHAHLFGKLLLWKGLKQYDYEGMPLDNIEIDQFGRPSVNDVLDFNISHSEEYVFCAIGENIRLGIDVEKIKEIEFVPFKRVMSADHWNCIRSSLDPLKTFYRYWTAKESIVKADGRGLTIPLEQVQINGDKGCFDNRQWFIRELDIDDQYSVSLASDKQDLKIILEKINFDDRG